MKAIFLVVLLGMIGAVTSAQAGISALDASINAAPKKPAGAKKVMTTDDQRIARDGTIVIGKRKIDRSTDVAGALRRVPYIFVRRR